MLITSAAVGNHGRRPSRAVLLAVVIAAVWAVSRAPVYEAAQVTRDAPETPLPSLAIELRPVFSQRRPILDIALRGNELYVLDGTGLTVYLRSGDVRDGTWKRQQSLPIVAREPWPRDLRGLMTTLLGGLTVQLPGLRCSSALPPVALDCAPETAWPIFELDVPVQLRRNMFVTPSGVEFYAVAQTDRADMAGASYVAGTRDGYLTLLDNAGRPLTRLIAGDDVASLLDRCYRQLQLLVRLDGPAGDSLGVFQIRNRQLVRTAPPRVLQGQITALWPGRMVVRANDPDRYDAYQIDLACVR